MNDSKVVSKNLQILKYWFLNKMIDSKRVVGWAWKIDNNNKANSALPES